MEKFNHHIPSVIRLVGGIVRTPSVERSRAFFLETGLNLSSNIIFKYSQLTVIPIKQVKSRISLYFKKKMTGVSFKTPWLQWDLAEQGSPASIHTEGCAYFIGSHENSHDSSSVTVLSLKSWISRRKQQRNPCIKRSFWSYSRSAGQRDLRRRLWKLATLLTEML